MDALCDSRVKMLSPGEELWHSHELVAGGSLRRRDIQHTSNHRVQIFGILLRQFLVLTLEDALEQTLHIFRLERWL